MAEFDVLNRYIFDDFHARGELVQLHKTYADIIGKHTYPKGVRVLLGELVAVTSLLTATLKFKGEITVQLQGDGAVGYMSVNGNDQQVIRGIARMQQETTETSLKMLLGKGTMVITIRPEQGEAYQGVVALEQETLAECLAHYFEVSEQIPTKIWLFSDDNQKKIAGSLIQLLPDGEDKEKQQLDFEHLCQLTNTIKTEEILSLDAKTLLYRLYHQENVRLFEPQPITFQCGCSAEKCLTAISQIEPDEIKAIIAEQGKVSMTCDYCLTTYDFDEQALKSFTSKVNH